MATRGQPGVGIHQLEMDGEWGLADLSGFGRQYNHLYAVLYSLLFYIADLSDVDEPSGWDWRDERAVHVYRAYPWRGGYSAVNFYQSLLAQIPKDERPRIVRIEYASPGLLEVALVEVIARCSIKHIVTVVSDTFLKINATYSQIHRDMHERRLMRISAKREEIALTREQQEFARVSSERLATQMGFEHLEDLRRVTGNDVATLKDPFIGVSTRSRAGENATGREAEVLS